MPHIIEEAKSSRATCRSCRQKIEKGTLRLGEEVPNAFDPEGGPAYAWHHLICGAKKKAPAVRAALETFTGTIPNREELDKALAEAKSEEKPEFPYAERAPTGRSKCLACEELIPKGELRIAIEREVDTGAFTSKSAGYLHPACASEHQQDPELRAKIAAHSRGLTDEDNEQLDATIGG